MSTQRLKLLARASTGRTRESDLENPLQHDSRALKLPVEKFLRMENRFNQLLKNDTEESRNVIAAAQHDVDARWKMYSYPAEK